MTAVVETAPETTVVPAREFPKYLLADLAGRPLPILRTTVNPKPGDTEVHYWYTFRQAARETGTRWGVKIPRVTEQLPTQFELDGVTMGLSIERSAATYKDKVATIKGGKVVETWVDVAIPEEKRKNVATFSGLQVLPSLASAEHGDTGIRKVTVKVSEDVEEETWNVTVKVNKVAAAASPEQRKESAQKQGEKTLAELDAILNSL